MLSLENFLTLIYDLSRTLTRFIIFQCEPALWDAKYFSAQARPRYFWGNIPGMYRLEFYSYTIGISTLLLKCHDDKIIKLSMLSEKRSFASFTCLYFILFSVATCLEDFKMLGSHRSFHFVGPLI